MFAEDRKFAKKKEGGGKYSHTLKCFLPFANILKPNTAILYVSGVQIDKINKL